MLVFWKSCLLLPSLLKWKSTRTKTLTLNRCVDGARAAFKVLLTGWEGACLAQGCEPWASWLRAKRQPQHSPGRTRNGIQLYKARTYLMGEKAEKQPALFIPAPAVLFIRIRIKPASASYDKGAFQFYYGDKRWEMEVKSKGFDLVPN